MKTFNFKGRLTVIGYTNEMKISELKSKIPNEALIYIDAEKETSLQPEFRLIGENGIVGPQTSIKDIRIETARNQKTAFIFTELNQHTQKKATLRDFKTVELETYATYVFGFTDTGGIVLKNIIGYRGPIEMEELYFPLLFM